MYQLYTLCIGNFSFEAEAWWYDSNCQTLQKKLSWFAYARGNPKMYFMYVKHVMGPAYEALIILAIVFVSLACLCGICFVQFLPVKRPLAHVLVSFRCFARQTSPRPCAWCPRSP